MLDDFVNSLSAEQKEALAKLLVETSTEDDSKSEATAVIDVQEIKKNDFSVGENFKVTRTMKERGDRKVRGKKNRWVDTGSNHGDDRDLETPDYKPTPRNRQKPNKMEVECHICGKTFHADPKFVYGEYHRCHKCTGR